MALGSCEKEEFALVDSTGRDTTIGLQPDLNIIGGTDAISELKNIPSDHKSAMKSYLSPAEKGGDELQYFLDSLLELPAIYVHDSLLDLDVASLYIENKDPLLLTNLVFVFSDEELIYGQVYSYSLDPNLLAPEVSTQSRIRSFSGEATVSSVNALFESMEGSKMDGCLKLITINNVLFLSDEDRISIRNNTGGGGVSGGTGSTGGSTSGGNNGTGGLPGAGDLEYCYDTRVGEISGHVYLVRVDCVTRDPLHEIDIVRQGVPDSPTQKTGEKIDCTELIRILGIHTGFLGNNWHEEEDIAWNDAMIGTAFLNNRIAREIINLDQLNECTKEVGKGATECAREQLQVHGRDLLLGYFGNGFPRGISSNLTDQQLMAVVEALFFADLNDNSSIFEAVDFVLQNLSHQFILDDVGAHIGVLSVLYTSTTTSFQSAAEDYARVLSRSTTPVSGENALWLAQNPSSLSILSDALNSVPSIDNQSIINLSKNSNVPDIVTQNLSEIYGHLSNRTLIAELTFDQITALELIPELLDGLDARAADVLFNDYSQFSTQEDAVPIIGQLLKKFLVRGGPAALIDFGLQLSLEHVFGGHASLNETWKHLDINWISIGASMVEANVKPKIGAYIATGVIGLESTYNLLVSDQEITLSRFLTTTVLNMGLGYFGANIGDYADKFFGKVTQYGFKLPFDGLRHYLRPQLVSFLSISSVFRRDVVKAIWRETNVAATQRGKYIEQLLSMTRFKGSNYTWTNLPVEAGGKVDFFSTSLSQAISVKSAKTLSHINPTGYFDQIYQGGIRDGIMVDGVLTKFGNLRIDVVIPEGATAAQISTKIDESYISIANRIRLNPTWYPEINHANLRNVLEFKIDFGYD